MDCCANCEQGPAPQGGSPLLGVLGGLGPMATAWFMELVTRMTDAQADQQHLAMAVLSTPTIPDRTAFIQDPSQPDPLPGMVLAGQTLARLGASVIAIPCVTAHYFWEQLSSRVSVPVINAVEAAAAELEQAGIRRVGLLATTGTMNSGIFRKALESRGLEAVLPDGAGQADAMHLIYDNIKAGLPADMERFGRLRESLLAQGAQAILLGCTELSLIQRDHPIGPGFLDVLQVLAKRAILACGRPVKPMYQNLLTGTNNVISEEK